MKRGIVATLGLALAVAIGFGLFANWGTASANHTAAPDEITISVVGSPVAAVGTNVVVDLAVTTSTAPHKGIQWELAYGANLGWVAGGSIATYNCTNPGGINYPSETNTAPTETILVPATIDNLGNGSNCASLSGPFMGAAMTGQFVRVELRCEAAGQTFISMRPATEPANPANDVNFGTSLLDASGAYIPTVLEPQIPIPGFGNQAAVGVACVSAVDLSITKTGPATAAEGGVGVYTLTVNNPTGVNQTADISDDIPAGVTATAASPGCVPGDPTVCDDVILAPGDNVFTITVTFDTCGLKTDSASVTLVDTAPPSVVDPNPANNNDTFDTDVDCAALTITKEATITGANPGGPGPGPFNAVQGDTVVYTYEVCNDAGGTTAQDVTVTDSNTPPGNVGPAQDILSGACATFTSGPIVLDTLGELCNTATADGTNTSPSAVSNEVCILVVPSLQGIAKDLDPVTPGAQSTGNLWICKGTGFPDDFTPPNPSLPSTQPNCNTLDIVELVSFFNDIDTCNDDDDDDDLPCAGELTAAETGFGACTNTTDDDADGAVNDGCPEVDGTSEVGPQCGNATDDDADGVANDGCPEAGPQTCQPAAENFIPGLGVDCTAPGEEDEGLGAYEVQVKYDHKLFQQPTLDCADGILSGVPGRSVQPTLTVITENWTLFGCVSKDDGGPPVAPGPDPSGDAGTLTVTIQPDLFQRIRPTKDNGVVTDLLDENCELADIFGMPLPGSVQGGLTPDCGDATITIRMLEGDVDLDCDVDISDDQNMAFRYGSFFGNLLYNRFFDLEPNIAPDFDIDIKDLQTVFGRNGSLCEAPIPDQEPSDQIPDP